jgi:hypothetical protein
VSEQWDSATFLLDMICGSFDTSLEKIKAPVLAQGQDDYFLRQFNNVVDAIANSLAAKGKYWVFVYDQINKLFPKTGQSSISGFQFPYSMISKIRKPRRVISILSASANNELADNHESFLEYQHPVNMTSDELVKVFGARDTKSNAQEFAGGHPYYVRNYLELGEKKFLDGIYTDVAQSAGRLQRDQPFHWASVLEAIVLCVLKQVRAETFLHDKKFLVPELVGTNYLFIPICPAVLAAYRRYFWDDVMETVAKNEALYLGVCAARGTGNDTRGRLFEALVIQRIKSRGLRLTGKWGSDEEQDDQIHEGSFSHFQGSMLPELPYVVENTLYIPDSSNFPAIDFFFRTSSTLVAFQVHVSKHKDVGNRLLGMCRVAGWFEKKVVLIYLSPTAKAAEYTERYTRETKITCMTVNTKTSKGGPIYLSSKTCDDFPDTLNFVWPEQAL